MSLRPETIERLAEGHKVTLSGKNNQHDVCDTITISKHKGITKGLTIMFRDDSGRLKNDLDETALKHVRHSTLTEDISNQVAVILDDDSIVTGLKALFKREALNEKGQTVSLISPNMQRAIVQECRGLLVYADDPVLIDNEHATEPELPTYD